MKRLRNSTLLVVVVLVTTTSPYSQTRPRRVMPVNDTPVQTVNQVPVERPVERRKGRGWMRMLGTAIAIGVASRGSCTPSRDLFRRF